MQTASGLQKKDALLSEESLPVQSVDASSPRAVTALSVHVSDPPRSTPVRKNAFGFLKQLLAAVSQAFWLMGFPSYFTKALGRWVLIDQNLDPSQGFHFVLGSLALIAPFIACLASVIVFNVRLYQGDTLRASGITALRTLTKFFIVYMFWTFAMADVTVLSPLADTESLAALCIVGTITGMGLLLASLLTETLPRYFAHGEFFVTGFAQVVIGAIFEGFAWAGIEQINIYQLLPGGWGKLLDVLAVSIGVSTAFILGCSVAACVTKLWQRYQSKEQVVSSGAARVSIVARRAD